jgi:hypothetical protein
VSFLIGILLPFSGVFSAFSGEIRGKYAEKDADPWRILPGRFDL